MEKKYGSALTIDERFKLFKEWFDNGGIETIWSVELLKDLMKVKVDDNGKVIRETVSSLVNATMLAHEGSQMMPPMESIEFITEYDTILQKRLFFDQINIDSQEQFDEIFEKLKNKDNILFRGVREAKWRLYSKLQREWVKKRLYDTEISYQKFIELLVNNARKEQKGVLSKFLYLNRIDPYNDIAVLSFLQHYGCPTPLLDWTYSFLNSLYFALDKIEYEEKKSGIDDYFSIYYIEETYFKSSSIRNIITEGLKGEKFKSLVLNNIRKQGAQEDEIEKIVSEKGLHQVAKMLHSKGLITFMTKIEHLIKFPISYFSDFDKENDLLFSLNNNPNIVNQHGTFTWNADSSKPLEQMGNEQVKEEHGNADGYKFCSCYNINKKLIDHARKRIKKEGIVKNFIYPDPTKIARNSFGNALKLKHK